MKKVCFVGLALLSVVFCQHTATDSTVMQNAFKDFDTNHDGFVSVEELKIQVKLKREDLKKEVVSDKVEEKKSDE